MAVSVIQLSCDSDDEYYDSRRGLSRDGSQRSRSRSDDERARDCRERLSRDQREHSAKMSMSTQTGSDRVDERLSRDVLREREKFRAEIRRKRERREREQDSSRSPSLSTRVRPERPVGSRDKKRDDEEVQRRRCLKKPEREHRSSSSPVRPVRSVSFDENSYRDQSESPKRRRDERE